MHNVYMVKCADGTFYTGYALDVAARIAVHNRGKGAKYTKARLPVSLVYCHACETKGEALRLEYRLKQLSRPQKLALIENPEGGMLP